jgi:hypothetical protein
LQANGALVGHRLPAFAIQRDVDFGRIGRVEVDVMLVSVACRTFRAKTGL